MKHLQELEEKGHAKSHEEWEGFRAMLKDFDESGIPWDERVRIALQEKQAAFRRDVRENEKWVQAAKERGETRALEEWDEFRAMLTRSELGGGMTFQQRIDKN